jgi:hypothetical protein
MATKENSKQAKASKPRAQKASVKPAASKSQGSIGFLRASQNAHVAVGDIPLTFLADLGIMSDKVQSAKDFNRRFIGGMYERLDSVATKIGDVVTAPAKLAGALIDKLQQSSASDVKVVRPAVKAAAPKARKPAPKAKTKAAPKAKAKAATPKAKARTAKPKAKPKVSAKASKPKARAKTSSAAATRAKSAKKALVATAGQADLNSVH